MRPLSAKAILLWCTFQGYLIGAIARNSLFRPSYRSASKSTGIGGL
jgi:hypothetical protein